MLSNENSPYSANQKSKYHVSTIPVRWSLDKDSGLLTSPNEKTWVISQNVMELLSQSISKLWRELYTQEMNYIVYSKGKTKNGIQPWPNFFTFSEKLGGWVWWSTECKTCQKNHILFLRHSLMVLIFFTE